MIELRWVMRGDKNIKVRYGDGVDRPLTVTVLQYRTIIPHASSFKTKWTDWQDVPTVTE